MNSFHSDSNSKSNANGGMRAAENGGSGSKLRPAKPQRDMFDAVRRSRRLCP